MYYKHNVHSKYIYPYYDGTELGEGMVKQYIATCTILIVLVYSSIAYAGRIAIIGAMDSEIAYIIDTMQGMTKEVKAGITFYTGRLNGKAIVLFKSGIGKVNSAMAITMALERYDIDAIIFTGVAGAVSPTLHLADIVISNHLVEHDYDTRALGGIRGHVPGSVNGVFTADSRLIRIAKESAEGVLGKSKVYIGTIVTGDQFIADAEKVQELRKEFNAMAVEMEGASVAHVAHLYGVPIVVIRAISDNADGNAHVKYNDFVNIAAKNAAKIVTIMVGKL